MMDQYGGTRRAPQARDIATGPNVVALFRFPIEVQQRRVNVRALSPVLRNDGEPRLFRIFGRIHEPAVVR
jgi:hypothetical protein